MIYFMTFFLSCIFTDIAQRFFKNDKKRKGIELSIIAILLPCLLAGFRSLDIGTDIKVYVNPFFQIAINSNNFFSYKLALSNIELLYSILNYIVSLFTNNVNVLLFIIQLIMTTLVYLYIYDQRNEVPMWLAMATYYTFIFPRFLNLIRQGIAVCIVLYSMKYLKQKRKKAFFISMIIALLFHSTAFFAIPIYFIYEIYNVSKNSKKTQNIICIIFLMMIVLVFSYDKFLKIFLNMGIFPEKFEIYFSKYLKKNIVFDWSSTLYKFVWLILLILPYKNSQKVNDYGFYYLMLIMDMVLWNFNYKILNAERLSYYYFSIPGITLIPQTAKLYKNDNFNKITIYSITIILFFIYWYIKFIYLNAGNMYPYHSTILGI